MCFHRLYSVVHPLFIEWRHKSCWCVLVHHHICNLIKNQRNCYWYLSHDADLSFERGALPMFTWAKIWHFRQGDIGASGHHTIRGANYPRTWFRVQFMAWKTCCSFCAIIAGFPTWWKIFTAATFSPREYFPSRWKACDYWTKIGARCMQPRHKPATWLSVEYRLTCSKQFGGWCR